MSIFLSELFPARFRGVPTLLEETPVRDEDYTLRRSDMSRVVPVEAATSVTITVPEDGAEEIPIGAVINVYNKGTNNVNVVGASGVTVQNGGILNPQSEASLRKRDTNEWVVAGDLA